jgi:glycosyltransferase involved in cell wall biosynthesis
MKVLVISDAWHPQINGVVRTYEYLLQELEARGHQTHVIGPGDFSRQIPMPGYGEIKLALMPYKELSHMIEAYKPDSIHIATEGPLGWAGRKYCQAHHLPFSTSYHTHFPDYVAKRVAQIAPFLYGLTHALAIRFVRCFHAPSQVILVATNSLEETLRGWCFKNQMARLSRGAKLDLFYPGEKTLYGDLKRPVALYVGRVAIEKNIEDFLKMAWEGSKVIVGDGPSRPSFQQAYPEALFVGSKTGTDLAAHFRSADVFVFPSRTDTFGMVIVEALASGVPVAGYDVTGPKDILTESFLGAVHKSDLSLAARQALRTGTAEQRAAYVREHYSWTKAGQDFETALQRASFLPER